MKTLEQVRLDIYAQAVTQAEQWVSDHGHCKDTLAAARLLCEGGKVHPTADPSLYSVESSSNDNEHAQAYFVNGACPCQGAKTAYKGRCRHRIAVNLTKQVRKRLYDMQQAFPNRIPHAHTYSCDHGGSVHCWDVACREIRDPKDLLCTTCEHAAVCEVEPAATLNTATGELTPLATVIDQRLATLEPPCDKEPTFEAALATLGPPDQYEVAPVLTKHSPPLPEAPASLNLKIKRGNIEVMFTMRAATDAEILARLPAALDGLQDILHVKFTSGE